MSSCYHICPTNVTFQFDTTFMYVMSVMMFLKLYQVSCYLSFILGIIIIINSMQVRHPDVSANAVGVFFGLGVALILETFSIYYSGVFFWIVFCTSYIAFMVVVAVHAYNLGVVKYDYKIVWVVIK